MDDNELKLIILREVRDFEVRKRTDDSLRNSAITLGGYERGLGLQLGVVEALCLEMAEDDLIRLGRGSMGGADGVRRRDVKTTSEGRAYLDTFPQSVLTELYSKLKKSNASDAEQAASQSTSGSALIFSSASLLDSILVYREKIRGDNHLGSNHPEHKEELLEFLDWLSAAVEELVLQAPITANLQTLETEPTVVSWRVQYWQNAKAEFAKYTSAESVAKTTVPAAIVLGASAIGLLIGGGAVGAGAGALIGNSIVGHAKPKEFTDKIESALEPKSQE